MAELTYKRLPAEDLADPIERIEQSRWCRLYTQSQTSYTDVNPDSSDLRRRCQEPLPPLPTSFWGQHLSGWRMGVGIGAVTAILVLLVNIVVIMYVSRTFEMEEPGLYTLIGESTTACATSKKWSMLLHLVINTLGTLLLGASNYCMQYLSAPTRLEVDAAHRKGRWLDIGILSTSNLKSISRQKVIVWLLLALSSLPLHLLFNCVVLESLSSNEFSVLVVNNEFLLGGHWNSQHWHYPDIQYLQDHINDNKSLERLRNSECIKNYAANYIFNRRNLLAVTSDRSTVSTPNSSVLSVSHFLSSRSTSGIQLNSPLNITDDPSTLSIHGHPVEFCLSEIVPERCKLQFSLEIMIIVIICNAIKVVCFVYTLWKQKDDSLTTIGDAIMSFLDQPDPTTVGLCRRRKMIFDISAPPEPWQPQRKRYYLASSSLRLFSCILFSFIIIIIAGTLLRVGIESLQHSSKPTDLGSLWKMGFGVVNPYTLITASSHLQSTSANLLGFVLLSNSPQIILSALYFMYNGVYTSMQMADEWNRFSYERKPLRVTAPKHGQRSTYFLQLPYRYGVPLIICSGLMHWLVSQSIFLAKVTVFDSIGNEDHKANVLTCGYSCIAIIFTLGVGGLMVLAVLAMGSRRLKPGIPLACYCSAAISAACHPPADDVHASVLPVMWGAVEDDVNGVALCTFTSKEVHLPKAGQFCTGMVDYSLDAKSTGFPKSGQDHEEA